MQIYNEWLRGRVLNELCKRISDTKRLDCAYLRYTQVIWKHQATSLQLLFLKSKIFKIISFFQVDLIQLLTVDSLLTDTSVKRTPKIGPCLSLHPLFDPLQDGHLSKTDT